MGTPMAVNYANIFLDKLETEMLKEYESKTNLKPFVWMRYIDDIFLIWTHGEQSLKDFLKFCDEYSTSKKMKSKIRYESSSSTKFSSRERYYSLWHIANRGGGRQNFTRFSRFRSF